MEPEEWSGWKGRRGSRRRGDNVSEERPRQSWSSFRGQGRVTRTRRMLQPRPRDRCFHSCRVFQPVERNLRVCTGNSANPAIWKASAGRWDDLRFVGNRREFAGKPLSTSGDYYRRLRIDRGFLSTALRPRDTFGCQFSFVPSLLKFPRQFTYIVDSVGCWRWNWISRERERWELFTRTEISEIIEGNFLTWIVVTIRRSEVHFFFFFPLFSTFLRRWNFSLVYSSSSRSTAGADIEYYTRARVLEYIRKIKFGKSLANYLTRNTVGDFDLVEN